jgi:hypothetical protein
MVERGRLVRLIQRFADAKDECCLAALVDDYRDEASRLVSELSPDHRAIVVRLLETCGDRGDAKCRTS